MKKEAKQEVKGLLEVAKMAITAAARIANDGAPAPKDIAELMSAWASIAKVISQPRGAANKAYATAQLEMLAGLMGEAE